MTTIEISNNLRVKNPTGEITKWARKNLTLDNPEYHKRVRAGRWTGNTPAHISLYEIHGDEIIIPYGCVADFTKAFRHLECTVVRRFHPEHKVDYNCSVPLYDYQQEAVEQMLIHKCGILQSPAGSGKTQMGIALTALHSMRTLWLTHTQDLLTQSRDRALQYMDSSLIGTITAGKVNIGKGITFATVQTMSKLDLPRYKDEWDVVIVDECHRCAGSPTALTMFYKVVDSLNAKHKYGLSATVHRADGLIKATFALLGNVNHIVPDRAVQDRVMRVGILPCYTGISIGSKALNTDGTINYARLINYLCEVELRNEVISNCIEDEREHSCLILSDRLEHLAYLLNSLPDDMRDKAVMICGKMTSKSGRAEREKAIEDMRSGEKKYLFATYSLAKEGLDIPRLERLFLTTPQKDYAVITQSIGRIARVFNGKADPVAYDFIDNSGYTVTAFKKRCATYKKNGCYFVEVKQ